MECLWRCSYTKTLGSDLVFAFGATNAHMGLSGLQAHRYGALMHLFLGGSGYAIQFFSSTSLTHLLQLLLADLWSTESKNHLAIKFRLRYETWSCFIHAVIYEVAIFDLVSCKIAKVVMRSSSQLILR